jgi:fructosamine-3-kinase
LNNQLRSAIEKILSENLGSRIAIEEIESLSGGSINDAYKIRTNSANYFVKSNSGKKYPGMFSAEKKGLGLLASQSKIKTPEVIAVQDASEESFLILEYVNNGKKDPAVFRKFGEALAMMHRQTNDKYGLDHDNYIGSLNQSNTFNSTWAEFFIEERLMPQIKQAFDNKIIQRSFVRLADQLFSRLGNLFPLEKPALLHGDLWSGNFMATQDGSPCFYDPAVYYGHREMDIAMTNLFGGFDDNFYLAYNENFPLEKEWIKRVDLCNLYPLLVHVNLFGGSYIRQAEIVLKKYI